MKYIRTPLLLLMMVILVSCSKNNDNENPIPDLDFFVKATVNGTSFIDDNDNNTFVVTTNDADESFAAFTSQLSDSDNLAASIYGFHELGTYDITDIDGSFLSYIFTDGGTIQEIWLANSESGSGTITITQYGNGTVRGTFSFTGYNEVDQTNKKITNGEFYLTLVEIN